MLCHQTPNVAARSLPPLTCRSQKFLASSVLVAKPSCYGGGAWLPCLLHLPSPALLAVTRISVPLSCFPNMCLSLSSVFPTFFICPSLRLSLSSLSFPAVGLITVSIPDGPAQCFGDTDDVQKPPTQSACCLRRSLWDEAGMCLKRVWATGLQAEGIARARPLPKPGRFLEYGRGGGRTW